jgi:hypothetical protein
MTRAHFAPGIDSESRQGGGGNYRPGQGAGGIFAKTLQGATPKYAINNGPRSDLFRNTMARIFVRVDAAEMDLFLRSVADSHTREQLVRTLVGDPTPAELQATTNQATPQATTARRRTRAQGTGYLDFFLQNVQMPLQEKVQVSETLSDNYVAYAFGQAPPMWNFTGALINSVQDDQGSNMFRLYTEILRATQMARRQKTMSIALDSYAINGVMTNMTMGLTADNQLLIPFSFQLLVKRVFITNFTNGWTPTTAGTPFPSDPLARDSDGTPREEGALTQIAARIPEGTVETTPVPDRTTNNNAAGTTTQQPAP